MRVQFEATLDDVVDAHNRSWSRSKTMRSWRWANNVSAFFLPGLFTWLLLLFVLIPLEPENRLLTSGLGGVLVACVYPFLNRLAAKAWYRKFFREQLGSDA